ncbi:hypothetical protein ColKHC_06370 [Colletotrichum higginsianum]|nr:hypothetical protein ColKHC_06370 [Colletotrichum higginsianum]
MGDQEAAPPSPASWIAGFDFWQGFGFDAGSSSTATVTVAAGRLDRIGRLVCLGLWEDAAIAKCQPRLAVACGVVAIVEAGVQYGNGRAFIMMQHLMKLFLTVGMLLLLSILSSALPPVDVLIARTKTARAPIGASPLQEFSLWARHCTSLRNLPPSLLKTLGAHALLVGTTAKRVRLCAP